MWCNGVFNVHSLGFVWLCMPACVEDGSHIGNWLLDTFLYVLQYICPSQIPVSDIGLEYSQALHVLRAVHIIAWAMQWNFLW